MAPAPQGFAVNDRVSHSEHGLGTISDVNPHITTIVFDVAGLKKFLTSIVRLERSDAPLPPKASRARKAKAAKKP